MFLRKCFNLYTNNCIKIELNHTLILGSPSICNPQLLQKLSRVSSQLFPNSHWSQATVKGIANRRHSWLSVKINGMRVSLFSLFPPAALTFLAGQHPGTAGPDKGEMDLRPSCQLYGLSCVYAIFARFLSLIWLLLLLLPPNNILYDGG